VCHRSARDTRYRLRRAPGGGRARHLYTAGQPDPDLVIRTSGEQRVSNFLLWQTVQSELYFCDAYWPAFREIDFLRALPATPLGKAGAGPDTTQSISPSPSGTLPPAPTNGCDHAG